MKLYSLRLQAIGPFAGEHHIDFDSLSRSGLFLMEGPTGAGKSTIIDAVVFALYGQLAGAQSSKERLHSHHAAVGVEPFVDLIFEVESGLFRVRRTPSFSRPKKRGDGHTTVNETVVLTRLTDIDKPDHGQPVSTRAQEAGDEITRLIGLNRVQFLQAIVLPQGQFANFLQSSGEERKELLQTIFRTDVYERITRELVERRKAAAAQIEQARRAVESATDVLARVADAEAPVADPQALVTDVQQQHAEHELAVEVACVARDESAAELKVAEALDAAITRRADLMARTARLDAAEAEITAAADRVDVAIRAGQVLPYVRQERAAAERQTAAADEFAAAAAAAPDVDPAESSQRIDHLTAEITRFAQLAAIESGMADRDAARIALVDRQLTVEARDVELARRSAARPIERAALVERQEQVQLGLAKRPELEAAAKDAAARLEAAEVVEGLSAKVRSAEVLVKQLAGDAATAEHVRTQLQVARIRGIAGELAEQLVVGEACVVCGSDSHPHPASRSADHPQASEIDLAETRVRQITESLTEARAALDVDVQQIEFYRQQAGGQGIAQAKAAHDSAVAELEGLQVLADQEHEVREAIVCLDRSAQADEDERRAVAADLATLAEQIGQAQAALDADRDKLHQAVGDDPRSLADIGSSLETERNAVRRLAAAVTSLAAADAHLIEVRDVLVQALTAHEFSGPDDVESAALPTAELERLQHSLQTHHSERARVAEGLAAADIVALGDGPTERPDLTLLAERHAVARDAHEATIGLLTVAARRLEQVSGAVNALRIAEDAQAAADADAVAVTRMAGLADGTSPQNLKKLTLGTYVLLRRFADVVAAANMRLGPMSDGRYRLEVSDEKERSSSGRRTGLALTVFDGDTGRRREPRTLSGGETFYVSLCLALGLADVVTAESGGVQLDTLFIDEGFGSLDGQTLDAVMGQLSKLSRGGRTVGIVSHVEDLKQRVADRITVRRRADGSSDLAVLAGR